MKTFRSESTKMALDRKQFTDCLNELDFCLFKAAEHKDCQGFHKDSELTAVLMLLVRCSSLLRSMLQLFEQDAHDAFQAVMRSFEEAWYLAIFFRYEDQKDRTAKWLAEKTGSWSPPLTELMAFAKGRG